jgi:hypothetical protein
MRTGIKFKFNFDEEIPNLDLKLSPQKKKSQKSKIIIHKKIKNGRRDSSTNNSELF